MNSEQFFAALVVDSNRTGQRYGTMRAASPLAFPGGILIGLERTPTVAQVSSYRFAGKMMGAVVE